MERAAPVGGEAGQGRRLEGTKDSSPALRAAEEEAAGTSFTVSVTELF